MGRKTELLSTGKVNSIFIYLLCVNVESKASGWIPCIKKAKRGWLVVQERQLRPTHSSYGDDSDIFGYDEQTNMFKEKIRGKRSTTGLFRMNVGLIKLVLNVWRMLPFVMSEILKNA